MIWDAISGFFSLVGAMIVKVWEGLVSSLAIIAPYVIVGTLVVWILWLVSWFDIPAFSYEEPFSAWSSIASALSFLLLVPMLIVQFVSARKQLGEIDQAITRHLKELRPVSTAESLEKFMYWMNEDSDKTLALLYVSKLSAVPGFWIRGSQAVKNSLTKDDYSNATHRTVHFVGPGPDTDTFKKIADLAIAIAKDERRLALLPEATRTHLRSLKNKTVPEISKDYQDTVADVLSCKGIKVELIDQTTLDKLSVNFTLRRIPVEHGSVYSPWMMMFFDDADVLNGKSIESDLSRAFFDPTIYESENLELGYMFRYIGNEATGLKLSVGGKPRAPDNQTGAIP